MNLLEMAACIARTTYTNEFCSRCGGAITFDESKSTVLIESGENKTPRSAHKDCSVKGNTDKARSLSIDNL